MAITYNGSNPFVGQPIPFVKISNEYLLDGNERIDRTVLTLSGEILACSLNDLFSKKDALAAAFAVRDVIIIDGLDTYQVENVENITFADSNYFSRVPYTISLQIKDDDTVLDKVVEVEFQENVDQSLNITRTISARGKEITSTSDQAWARAKAYVEAQASLDLPKPFSIDSKSFQYFLVSSEENFDRINKKISLTQTFRSELYRNSGPILRHTKTVTDVIGNETQIEVQGTIECGRENGTTTGVALYKTFKADLVNSSGAPVRNLKNEVIGKDEYAAKLTFSFQYTDSLEDDNNDGYILTYIISLQESGDSSLIQVGITGTLKIVSSFTQSQRNDLINRFNARVVDRNYLYDKVNTHYNQFFSPPSGVHLNTKPLASNYSVSKNGTSIQFSASFDDRFELLSFRKYNYVIKTDPSIKQISIKPSLKGGYYFVDLGYLTKAKKQIDVSSTSCDEDLTLNQIDWANLKVLNYIQADANSENKNSLISKSYSANNGGEYSSSVSRIYNGVEFTL